MKALYRKYRPLKMAEVIGQEQVTKPLENALKLGKISHAYIFIGPRGCGKTSVARIFAHEINKFPYKIEDSYPDIIEIDAASNTGVDNIRELREKAVIAPSEGKFKVYIIDEVHMLSKSAFNALLKTLEEPPKHVIFIMATTDAYKIPATITSRAQVYNFQLADPRTMLEHLKKVAQEEKIKISEGALGVIVNRGGGSFRDTISLLDQVSTLSEAEITEEMVLAALGAPEEGNLQSLLDAYAQGSAAEITETLKKLLNSGVRAEAVAEKLINMIISDPRPELLPLLEKLPEVAYPFPEAKLLLAFLAERGVRASVSDFSAKSRVTAVPEEKGLKTPVNAKKVTEVEKVEKAVKNPETEAENMPNEAKTEVGDFDWQNYLTEVSSKNDAVAGSLKRSEHQRQGNTLILYSRRSFDRKILSSPNNLEILNASLPAGMSVKITDDSTIIKKDQKISKISGIMGDVQEVEENTPF